MLHLCLEIFLFLGISLLIYPKVVYHPIFGVILPCRPASRFEGSIVSLVKVKKTEKSVSKAYLSYGKSWILHSSLKRYRIHTSHSWPVEPERQSEAVFSALVLLTL